MGDPHATIGRFEVEETVLVEPLGQVLRCRVPALGRRFYLRQCLSPAALGPFLTDRLREAFLAETETLGALGLHPFRPVDLDSGGAAPYVIYALPEDDGWTPLPPALPQGSPRWWLEQAPAFLEALGDLVDAGVPLHHVRPEQFWTRGSQVVYCPLSFVDLALQVGAPLSFCAVDSRFLAPEARAGEEPTAAALVFSAAAWLYWVLAKRQVSPAEAVAGGAAPEPLWRLNPEVPGGVDDLLQRALSVDPAARWPTCGEMAAAWRSGTAGSGAQPASVSNEPTLALPASVGSAEGPGLDPRLMATGAAGLCLLGLLTGLLAAQWFPPP
jgi:hypothetical protein